MIVESVYEHLEEMGCSRRIIESKSKLHEEIGVQRNVQEGFSLSEIEEVKRTLTILTEVSMLKSTREGKGYENEEEVGFLLTVNCVSSIFGEKVMKWIDTCTKYSRFSGLGVLIIFEQVQLLSFSFVLNGKLYFFFYHYSLIESSLIFSLIFNQ
jgi:hypothetical protein